MTTRSDSDECLVQDPLTSSEKASISREDSAEEDSLKVVSLSPPLENDSVVEISSKNQVKSSPFASVTEKEDSESIHPDSVEVSLSEAQAMDVDCPGVLSVSEAASAFLEENKVGEELQQIKETSALQDDVHKMEETDVSVVCKGQEDSDVQRLLEAEKRRLLAEIETGAIFRKEEDAETLAVASDFHQKVERVRVKDNAFVGRSVKIDVVDDTALLNVVPFCKKGKDHHHHAKRSGTAHGDDKEAPRKHKKTGVKHQHVEASGGKIMYSLNQMKSMRYANMGNQRKLWSDMYARLLPELVSEYEGLVSLKKMNQKNSKSSGIGTKEGMDDLTLEEEEEEEEYSEDNDDYNSILKPAFEVDGEPDFESGPPEDGFEYLRRVRWEAKRVPNVKVAKIDESKYITKEQSVYMPQIPEIPKCPEHLLPLKEWEDSLLSDFSHLRLALSQTDNNFFGDEIMSSSPSTEYMLMGMFSTRLNTVTDESFGVVVSEIQGMDSVTRVSRLKKRICLVEKESGLQDSDCIWVVALCASVDTPLDGDTCACLRALLRKCASVRALEVEDEQVIIMANMLITIAGRYFGQME
ncbi:uncharacterized protein LOC108808929 isoform X2 [Raphanus sativus]|uniref:Uncharacterized protein LOC108808929 isoform X2 n=1 Tax=Raphanus sativus TaxID=3726 RepID=A0A6J0JLK4_RAPSA|nr:uncharacterized protein LOC108808929 isoform X2 [Raphanus sativus]